VVPPPEGPRVNTRLRILAWLLSLAGIAAALTLVDGRTASWSGWLSYLLIAGLCAAAGWLAWRSLGPLQPPRWLAAAALVAVALRLGLAVAFTHLLPLYGSDRVHQQAGYFYPDAYDRDRIAWEFGRSDRPLWEPSARELRVDQYGGLLIWSAAGYRVLSPEAHRPLLVVLQAASASSLMVLFAWGFVSLAIGSTASRLAAWLVALYPEAILLGASQMREPFMGLGLSLLLYGFAVARQSGLRRAAAPLAVGSALSVIVSPPSALVGAAILAGAWLWERRSSRRLPLLAWVGIVAAAVIAFFLATRAWEGAGIWGRTSWRVLLGWLTRTAEYEMHILEQGSGMVQALFDRAPAWTHVPLATAYGLVRPFLPAALFETSTPLAQAIEIFRAVAWFALLPFLIYATLSAPRAAGWRSLPTYLAVLVWVTAIAASFRGGADGWDNVRYRAAFLVVQAALAGWGWAQARQSGSPWLARLAILVAAVTVVFSQWYAGRYLGTPALNLTGTLLAAGAALLLLGGAFVALDRRGLTRTSPGV